MPKKFGVFIVASVFAFWSCSSDDSDDDKKTTDNGGNTDTVTALTDAEALTEVQNGLGANCSTCHASGGSGSDYAVYNFASAADWKTTCITPVSGTTTKKLSEITATMPKGTATTYWETATGKSLLKWATDNGC